MGAGRLASSVKILVTDRHGKLSTVEAASWAAKGQPESTSTNMTTE